MPTITFKVSVEEARAIRAKARAAKRSVSSLLRASVLPEKVARRPRLLLKKHPISGLPYNAGGKDLPPVSMDDIKAALADFP